MRQPPAPTAPTPPGPTGPGPAANLLASGPAVDRDELTRVWGDDVFPRLPTGVKALYRVGRWAAVDSGGAVFALPNRHYRDGAEERRSEVEAALAARFGGRIPVRLEVDGPGIPIAHASPPAPPEIDDSVTAAEFAQMEVAPDAPASAEARLLEAFPGTEVTGQS